MEARPVLRALDCDRDCDRDRDRDCNCEGRYRTNLRIETPNPRTLQKYSIRRVAGVVTMLVSVIQEQADSELPSPLPWSTPPQFRSADGCE